MKRFQLNERQLGYLMVLPSLLLVCIVVLWPVAQSFWNSMFDYRLNDPTRSQLMMSAHMDLEGYVNNHYYLEKNIKELLTTADHENDKQKIIEIQTNMDKYHTALVNDDEKKQKMDKINELLMVYKPVSDMKLKYSKVDNSFASDYRDALDSYKQVLTNIAQLSSDETFSQKASQTADLMGSVSQTILKSNFIGLDNYSKYFKNKRMWSALWNTTFFTIISVSIELIIGLAIALLINRTFKGRGLIRASVLIPWAIPTAVAAMMWGFLYDGQSGIISHYFANLHVIPNESWLLSTSSGGMFSIILADVWKTTPYMALLLLAGLQTIPNALYEASNVDGASKIQQFWSITLPLLKSSILVALLFRTLDAFRVFDLIYVLTRGGPANATESISIYAYKTLFAQQNFGEGSVLSVIVFLCVALISIVYVRLIGSELFAGRSK